MNMLISFNLRDVEKPKTEPNISGTRYGFQVLLKTEIGYGFRYTAQHFS